MFYDFFCESYKLHLTENETYTIQRQMNAFHNCGAGAINMYQIFSNQQTKQEESSSFSAPPTADASSASELLGVISEGF